MYAIIEAGGKQFWVHPGETIHVDRLDVKEGETIALKALWAGGDASVAASQGGPAPSASVKVEVLGHLRGPKIIVFKKRRKKAYQKTQGHRQELTALRVKEIAPN